MKDMPSRRELAVGIAVVLMVGLFVIPSVGEKAGASDTISGPRLAGSNC